MYNAANYRSLTGGTRKNMTQFDNRPIGVFDSGVGGLTVVRSLRSLIPDEEILYFGDMARCPYGDRHPREVQQFSKEVLDFLYNQGVKALVVACNTATAAALPILQARYPIPVIGVIQPGARAAIRVTRTQRIGVIGTAVTIQSGAYPKAVHHVAPDVEVFSEACPQFVPLVEQGLVAGADVEAIVAESLADLLRKDIDTLVLGCTHYPLLAPTIQAVTGPNVQLISSAEQTAEEVKALLRRSNSLHAPQDREARPSDRFYTSSDGSRMRRAIDLWLGDAGSPEFRAALVVPVQLQSAQSY